MSDSPNAPSESIAGQDPQPRTLAESFQLPLVQYLLLFLLVLCVFVPTFWYTYVWDDWAGIAKNESIRAWHRLPDYFTDPNTFSDDPGDKGRNEYRPFRNIYFLLTYKMHGLHPAGWHFNHVLIHCLASVLVLAFFHRLYRYAMAWPADRILPLPVQLATWFAVAAWAVHPANTEVTAWLKSADDVLAVILVMCAMLLLFPKQGLLTWKRAIWAAVLIAIAFLTKESIAPIPLIYAVLAFWLAPDRRAILRHKPFWGAVGLLFLDLFLYLIVRKVMLGKLEQVPYMAGSFSLMMATMTTAVVRYLQLTFWPFWPTVQIGDYWGWPLATSWGQPSVIFSLCVLAAIAVIIIAIGRYSKVFLAGWAFTILAFTPAANLVPMMQVMAERFMYFPLLGIALAVAALYKWWLTSPHPGRKAVVPALVTGALIMQTHLRLPDWLDEQNFQKANMAALPDAGRAIYNYSVNLLKEGKTSEALSLLLRAQDSLPSDRTGIAIANIVYDNISKTSATHYLDKLTSSFPNSALPDMTRGDFALREKRTLDALHFYELARKKDPDNIKLLVLMAYLAEQEKDTTAALVYYKSLLRFPDHPTTLPEKIKLLSNE